MALPVTPINQTFFNTGTLPPSEGTPLGVELDAGNDLTNKIRPLIGQVMNSEMLLSKFNDFMDHYGPSKNLIKDDDLERCTNALLDAGLLKKTSQDLQWKAYANSPAAMSPGENQVFAPLKKIVDAIFKYAGARRGNKYNYNLVPYEHLDSDIAGLNHKMDACIMEYSGTLTPSTNNCVVPQEFKKYRNTPCQIEVRQQIVGDCQHIMSDDPRRMFIYAITIENTRFSVWYFSRSHSVKAISFDWLSKRGIRQFIHVFLAFALASPEDLGIDPRVLKAKRENMKVPQEYIYVYPKTPEEVAASPEPTNNIENPPENVQGNTNINRTSSRLAAKAAAVETKRLYAQQAAEAKLAAAALEAVNFRYFRTVGCVGTMRPYCISGRITRIWKVKEIRSALDETFITNKELILKDVWLDENRPTETANLESIFSDIEHLLAKAKEQYPGDDWLSRFMSEDKRFASFDQPAKDRLQSLFQNQSYKSLFLTKVVVWQGKVSKVVSDKAARSPHGIDVFAEVDITDHKPAIRTTTAMGSLSVGTPANQPPTRTTPQLEVNPRFGRRYVPKQQSRFIYQEVCTDLTSLGTLGNFMDIVDQALTALQVLFCAGWIHRDISIGNILTFDEGGGMLKVKLSDLEFAQKLGYNKHRSDPRTGTPYFMPLEIMRRNYLLDSHRPVVDTSLAEDLDLQVGTPEYDRYKGFQRFTTRIRSIPANATEDIPLKDAIPRYNFQHDLESLWWLVLYMISRGIQHYPSREYAKKIFQKTLAIRDDRTRTFVEPVARWGASHLHPKLLVGFLPAIDDLRRALYTGYLTMEVFGLLKQHEAYSSIHGTFSRLFRELLEKNEGGWKDLPLIDPRSSDSMKMEEPIIGSKHARDDSDDSSDSTNDTGNKRIKMEEDVDN